MMTRCSQCGVAIIPKVEELDLTVTSDLGTLARHSILMHTNKPPDEPELAYIRDVVSKTNARLACIGDEISRLEERLNLLAEERAMLSEYRRKNCAVMSPLRRLPPEILCQIFLWTLVSRDIRSPAYYKHAKENPWILTRISRRWKEVAVATPSLWSLVYVHAPLFVSPLSMIQTQLQRARALRVHFYGCQSVTSTQSSQIELFRFLSEHSTRWEELNLRLTTDLVPLVATLGDKLPALRKLTLEWDGGESQEGVDSIKCFETASSLMEVAIRNGTVPVSLPLHHHRLTRYDMTVSWETHRQLLKSLPNLVEARVAVYLGDWSDINDKISLLRLERLCVTSAYVLSYLKTPSLKELALSTTPRGDSDLDHQCFSAFMRRSSCSLQRLCLRGPINPQATEYILREHQSITEIILLHAPSFKVHFALLTYGEAKLAPQLSAIHFGFQWGLVDYELYLKMLESRWNAEDCTLATSTFLLDSSPLPDCSARSRIDALKEDGLNISVVLGFEARIQRDSWLYNTA